MCWRRKAARLRSERIGDWCRLPRVDAGREDAGIPNVAGKPPSGTWHVSHTMKILDGRVPPAARVLHLRRWVDFAEMTTAHAPDALTMTIGGAVIVGSSAWTVSVATLSGSVRNYESSIWPSALTCARLALVVVEISKVLSRSPRAFYHAFFPSPPTGATGHCGRKISAFRKV